VSLSQTRRIARVDAADGCNRRESRHSSDGSLDNSGPSNRRFLPQPRNFGVEAEWQKGAVFGHRRSTPFPRTWREWNSAQRANVFWRAEQSMSISSTPSTKTASSPMEEVSCRHMRFCK
jgi:hypothetical protein